MPTLSFYGGSPTYIDAAGQFHQAKVGPKGYVYLNSDGKTWSTVPSSVTLYTGPGTAHSTVAPGTPGGPPAPSATPAAPAPDPNRWRLDPTYLQQLEQNAATEQTTVTGLTGERGRQLQRYGYAADFDPNTQQYTGNLRFDPTDPYSRAAALKRSYDAQRVGTGLQRAARGGLYTGAYQGAQDIVNAGQLQATDQLQKSVIDYITGVGGKIAGARTARGQADIDAATAAQTRAANAPY